MTTEQVAAVLDQNAGATRRGALVVDCTTGSPERVEALGRALADRRVDYVDATIAGSSAEVRLGEGIVMAGGSEAAYRRCTDLFASFARRAFHLGPCGAGSRMKLAYNLVLGLNRAALAEALAFAEALGVDPATALEVMREGPAYSRAMDVKGRKMLARDYEPQARLAQHRKDVGLMLEAAARCGARVPFTRVHADLLQSLIDMGLGDLDNSAIIEAFRR
jgi:3-hydroxyisobutyrate dehydrogenase-like beta-hydroxyacid dehydrogenase